MHPPRGLLGACWMPGPAPGEGLPGEQTPGRASWSPSLEAPRGGRTVGTQPVAVLPPYDHPDLEGDLR